MVAVFKKYPVIMIFEAMPMTFSKRHFVAFDDSGVFIENEVLTISSLLDVTCGSIIFS